jgi:ElaB/YqjD/DUF883 family membrane-anchored ribosome-binding protein
METTQHSVKNGIREAKQQVEEEGKEVIHTLERRATAVRDLALDLRERAELAIQERPYIVPVAAGAVGFGVGVLVASRLSRMVLLAAAGAMLSDTVRGQIVKLATDMLNGEEEGVQGEEGEEETGEDVEEPSVT